MKHHETYRRDSREMLENEDNSRTVTPGQVYPSHPQDGLYILRKQAHHPYEITIESGAVSRKFGVDRGHSW